MLLPFLKECFLGHNHGAAGITVFGCDLEPQPGWWPTMQEWVSRNLGPSVQLSFAEQDLAQASLPPAGLILAVHPRATLFGPWYSILGNVLASRLPGARCVIATFFEVEALAVQEICRSLGARVDIRENPYYAGRPRSDEGTALRYAVLVEATPAARRPP